MENWPRKQKLIYLSSVLDTRGHFYLYNRDVEYFSKKIEKQRKIYEEVRAIINFSSVKKELVYLIKKNFGGSISLATNSRHNPVYVWQLSSHQKLLPVLQKITPYLYFNKEKATLMQDFIMSDSRVSRDAILENFNAIDRENHIKSC